MVNRAVEKALNLRRVKVYRDQAVGTSGLVKIGDQAGRDWLATLVLLVLTGVRKER